MSRLPRAAHRAGEGLREHRGRERGGAGHQHGRSDPGGLRGRAVWHAVSDPFEIPPVNVSRAYGVPNHFGDGLATGSIFVIDTHGNVRWSKIYTHIKDHVPTVEIADQLTAEGRTPCGVRPSPRPNLIAGTTYPFRTPLDLGREPSCPRSPRPQPSGSYRTSADAARYPRPRSHRQS